MGSSVGREIRRSGPAVQTFGKTIILSSLCYILCNMDHYLVPDNMPLYHRKGVYQPIQVKFSGVYQPIWGQRSGETAVGGTGNKTSVREGGNKKGPFTRPLV